MATDPGTIDFLLDQLGPRAARYSTRRMFGEYCLYREGLPVALVCDDVLFVKDTDGGRAAVAGSAALEFASPYPGARPHLRIAPDGWDDGDWLDHVLERTAAALPPAKPRKARAAATPAAAKPTKGAPKSPGTTRASRAAPKPPRPKAT